MYKVDFHTHSSNSPDGGITASQYARTLTRGVLDYVAITDHDTITTALELKKVHGDKIIVGEEITTSEGELVGLFLHSVVKPGQTALATAKAIRSQGGIVYIPHPFETVRKGLTLETLDGIKDVVDIIETHNGRAVLQNRGGRATSWARQNSKAVAASSDAHGVTGLGTTFTTLPEVPTVKNIMQLMQQAHFVTKRPPVRSLLYPKYHRLRKRKRTP